MWHVFVRPSSAEWVRARVEVAAEPCVVVEGDHAESAGFEYALARRIAEEPLVRQRACVVPVQRRFLTFKYIYPEELDASEDAPEGACHAGGPYWAFQSPASVAWVEYDRDTLLEVETPALSVVAWLLNLLLALVRFVTGASAARPKARCAHAPRLPRPERGRPQCRWCGWYLPDNAWQA
jgi:hypothetical protein